MGADLARVFELSDIRGVRKFGELPCSARDCSARDEREEEGVGEKGER